jgi:hypothetical protein
MLLSFLPGALSRVLLQTADTSSSLRRCKLVLSTARQLLKSPTRHRAPGAEADLTASVPVPPRIAGAEDVQARTVRKNGCLATCRCRKEHNFATSDA